MLCDERIVGMQYTTFTLQAVTPLFLAGADQQTAELRAPSFRGLMRYWERALIGGVVGATTHGLEQVIAGETDLFGSTNTGSAISIRVSATSSAIKEFTERISEKVGGKWQATGKGYFLWSMAKSGRVEKGNLKPARWYFPPGTRFQVTLSTRSQDITHLRRSVAALWLLVQLGGIGSRSRRCAGSLAVEHVEGDCANFLFTEPSTAQTLKQLIEDGLQTARALYSSASYPVTNARFDILARGFCRIWILQDEHPWQSAEEAMRTIGERLQYYRSSIPLRQRPIFGLPLPPFERNERRASPLLLRVTRLQGNKYVGVAVLFKTTYSGIQVKDYQLIEKWIHEFRGNMEVIWR